MSSEQSLARSRAAEFAAGWLPLVTAFVGVATCLSVVTGHTAGTFIVVLSRAFGWTRTELSLGAMIGGIVTTIASPLVGKLVDRYGPRPIAAISILCSAAGFFLMSVFVDSLASYLIIGAGISVFGAGATVVTYIAFINRWFVSARGMAIGITMAATGVTAIVMPRLMIPYIFAHGWQAGYRALAMLMIVTLPIILIGMRASGPIVSEAEACASPVWGPTLAEARRRARFWRLGMAFLLLATSLAGLFVHLVPMLTDMKRSPSEIASIISWFGLAVLVGRLIAGWLLDRVFASYLAILFVCGAMIGIAAIYVSGPTLTYVGAILVGLAYGTELDIAGYMTARYFGNRAYGAIYGWQYGMFMAGGILSPLLYGIAHDRFGSYQLGLLGSLVLMAPTILLFLTMGPYPDAREIDFSQPSIAPDTIAAG